jgi:hypothetical protein
VARGMDTGGRGDETRAPYPRRRPVTTA